MLRVGMDLIRRAHAEGWAVPAFSVYGLEQSLGVVRGAADAHAPVLLQAGSSAFAYAGETPLAALALAVARDAPTPVGVHLDHATDEAELLRCLERGYSSVMIDGSALAFEENVRRTAAVVAAAHAAGAWVEGELAGYGGDEDESAPTAAAGMLTDPDEAARFVSETGVDALAVAVGNVHGIPAAPVRLDLERLAAIGAAVDVPLVLHGASGLPDSQVQEAIALGVAKLNVNAELRRAARAAVCDTGREPPSSDAFAALLGPMVEATRGAARVTCERFGAARRCPALALATMTDGA